MSSVLDSSADGWSLATREALASMLRERIARDGSWSWTCTGGSMEPTVPGGSIAEVESLPAQVHIGEFLVCLLPARAVVSCHRVIAVHNSGAVLTRGDNRTDTDGWVDRAQQIGVVRRYRVGGKYFSASTAHSPSRYRVFRQRATAWLERTFADQRESHA